MRCTILETLNLTYEITLMQMLSEGALLDLTRHLSLHEIMCTSAHTVSKPTNSRKLTAFYLWDFELIKGDKLHSDFLDSQNSFSWSRQTCYCYLC